MARVGTEAEKLMATGNFQKDISNLQYLSLRFYLDPLPVSLVKRDVAAEDIYNHQPVRVLRATLHRGQNPNATSSLP